VKCITLAATKVVLSLPAYEIKPLTGMKQLLLSAFLFMASFTLSAQSLEIPNDRSAYIGFFQTKLNLNQTQTIKAGQIFDNRVKNMAELASLRESNPALYNQKMANLSQNTEGSFRLMLRGEQIKRYDQYKRQRRNYRYERTKKMQVEGLDQAQIAASLAEGDF
jgi:hypothetical protein